MQSLTDNYHIHAASEKFALLKSFGHIWTLSWPAGLTVIIKKNFFLIHMSQQVKVKKGVIPDHVTIINKRKKFQLNPIRM